MADNKITPGVLVNVLRENQNSNKTLKAQFSNQFFPKFNYDELSGLQKSIEKIQKQRAKGIIKEEIEFLKKHGYKVSTK